MSSDKSQFLLLYGSQTGQAQGIAEEIADRAPGQGLNAELRCLSLTEKRVGTNYDQHLGYSTLSSRNIV